MTARADTYVVEPDGSGEQPTIQAAVNAAAAGDTILLAAGTFTGDGNRDVDFLGKDLVVISQDHDVETCIIDCQGAPASPHRGFTFQASESRDAVLQEVTIRNGWAEDGGAIAIDDFSSPTIRQCRLENSVATYPGNGYGGAIYCYGSPLIDSCLIRGNRAGNRGGGIYAGDGPGMDAEIVNCVVLDDQAEDGGGLHVRGTVLVDNCLVAGNIAGWGDAYGGGISCRYHAGQIVVSTVAANQAGEAAGIALYGDLVPSIERTLIAFNLGAAGVGCIGSSQAALSCCDIYGNDGGDRTGCIADQQGTNGNFRGDPGFCSLAMGDFRVCSDSWCLPGLHAWGCATEIIGAFGSGCAPCQPVAAERRSLGSLKALYR
jgi:predicted outer membrane repeat protein